MRNDSTSSWPLFLNFARRAARRKLVLAKAVGCAAGHVSPNNFAKKGIGACVEQRPDAAEIVEQPFCHRLGIDAGQGEGELIFDQLIIVKTLRTRVEQPLATQQRAMAGGVQVVLSADARPCRSLLRLSEQ